MADTDVQVVALDPDGGETFQPLRRQLGITSFGMNLITMRPGQRSRVHMHERQEEAYLVLEGELTLMLEGGEQALSRWQVARVPAEMRRQLLNRGPGRLVLLALGGHGEHEGRDGKAWGSWEEGGEGRPPQEVPLPSDLPAA